MSRPLRVPEISKYIESVLTTDPILRRVAVIGEVANIRFGRYTYFDLREGGALIGCVAFDALNFPDGFGNGSQAVCGGRIITYQGGGKYQLRVSSVELVGEGEKAQKLDALRKKLFQEGLFDEKRKKRLPVMPRKIGLISSRGGAAIHDFINEVRLRFPVASIEWIHSTVQGDGVSEGVRTALSRFEAAKEPPDVIVIARGGGSDEHLEGFNDEALVRAVAACGIPVVSAIGHQIDYTLLDFAADARASTPTEAAILVTPSKEELHAAIEALRAQLETAAGYRVAEERGKLGKLFHEIEKYSPLYRVKEQKTQLDRILFQSERGILQKISLKRNELGLLLQALREPKPAPGTTWRLLSEEGRPVGESEIQKNGEYVLAGDMTRWRIRVLERETEGRFGSREDDL